MTKQNIPPLVFVIIGAIVTAVSFSRDSLQPFIYVGIIFILYGAVRLLFRFLTNRAKKKRETKQPDHNSTDKHSLAKNTQFEQPEHVLPIHYHPQTSYQYVICPNCSYHMHTSYRFCPRCGYEVPTK